MVHYDSMGLVSLQLIAVRFLNFLPSKLSRDFSNFAECRYYTTFKGQCFRIAQGSSHMIGHAGSPICVVHDDVTLTRS